MVIPGEIHLFDRDYYDPMTCRVCGLSERSHGGSVFRACDTYDFDLLWEGDAGPARIPCRIQITSAVHVPDIDPCVNPPDKTSAQLTACTRYVVSQQIAKVLDGKSFDEQSPQDRPPLRTPEDIAVWVYWLARDQSMAERHDSDWRLVIESVRVIYAERAWVEYAPTDGDR